VQQYEELKRELADRYRDNREDYTNGKAAFVEEILDLALAAGKLDLQLLRPDLLSPIAKAEIRSLDRHTVWGGDGRVAEWAPEREAVVVGRLEGRLATYVGIVLREILVDGQPTRVAGIASVMTEPELQGRGFATAALKLAVGHMQSVEAEFALLTALEHRRTFYERLGWRVVANSVVCDQANGKVHLNDPGRHEMVLPLRGDLVGDGRIDLCGLPW
jgi:GNAT superfamily N-acetyltransferase